MATSEASARVGTGELIIDSSICVATITGLPARRQARTMRRWIAGTFSAGSSTPEIAARHHDGVGLVDDLVQALDRRWLLELGHDPRASPGQRTRLVQILGTLHER